MDNKVSKLVLLLNLTLMSSCDPMLTDVRDMQEKYDFIVVGAGTSGSVVARRLSEVPSVTVLLLESGQSDMNNRDIHYPFHSEKLIGSDIDWNFDVVEQRRALLKMEELFKNWPRGKTLGGSSALNGMMWLRGSSHDFDSWEDHGAYGWNWKNVEPYYKKIENAVDDSISKNVGRNGPLNISHAFVGPFSEKLFEAGREIGLNKVDYHDDPMEGISILQNTVFKGVRQTSSDAYLRHGYTQRKKRLHIISQAHVSKVLTKTDSNSGKIKATSVEFFKNNKKYTVEARKEIILSAGTIGTPQILMLSGIGPRQHLKDKKIKCSVDSPGVGSNMQDHIATRVFFRDNLRHSVKNHYEGETPQSAAQYLVHGTGYLANSYGFETVLHTRTKYFGTEIPRSTMKRPFPSIQMLFTPKPAVPLLFKTTNVSTYTIAVVGIQHPKSTGTIRLRSIDPFEQPDIDPNYLSNEDDTLVLIEGMKLLETLEKTSTMKNIGYEMLIPSDSCGGSSVKGTPRSEDFYRCFIKSYAMTVYHPCCTAKIGRESDEMAVVDYKLRVIGVEGLRVADASVMPHLPSTNTQAACYMIGEKASDMIKQYWNL